MRKFATAVGVFATVLTTTAVVPTFVAAQSRYDDGPRYERQVDRRRARARRSYYNRNNCYASRRSDGNKGTVAGALVGGASGALIGGDVLGGLVGAGVGAVAGHQIAKSRTRC